MNKPISASSLLTALSGRWSITRTLFSTLPSLPSGTFTGHATFTPSPASPVAISTPTLPPSPLPSPSSSPSSTTQPITFTYHELGTFTPTTNQIFTTPMRAERSYIYKVTNTSSNVISCYFDNGKDLFHEVEIVPTTTTTSSVDGDRVEAKGTTHLCGDDVYNSAYVFVLDGEGSPVVKQWTLCYDVKGPRKSYKTRAVYTRATEDD